jgi:hypothetical protein
MNWVTEQKRKSYYGNHIIGWTVCRFWKTGVNCLRVLCWIWYSLVCYISVFRRDIHPPSSVKSISRQRKRNRYFVAWSETFKSFCTLPDSTAGWAVDVAFYLSVKLQSFFLYIAFLSRRKGRKFGSPELDLVQSSSNFIRKNAARWSINNNVSAKRMYARWER